MIMVRWIQEFWFMYLQLFMVLCIRFVHLQVLVDLHVLTEGGGVASQVVADGL